MKTSDQIFSNSPYIRRVSKLSHLQLTHIDQYLQALLHSDSDLLRKTHYFHDRYENIYLKHSDNEELNQLMDESLQFCAELIDVGKDDLSIGYWFNLMQPGHVTDWHTHDDLDELISGVVYLTVPENSGNLILKTEEKEIELVPKIGNFVYFDPKTPHVVTENKSSQHRLSIGMNIGLKSTSHSDFMV